jgi:hypothetical protein
MQFVIVRSSCRSATESVGMGAWASDDAWPKMDAPLSWEMHGDDYSFGYGGLP